jgi:CheY-like chemotaxis protein
MVLRRIFVIDDDIDDQELFIEAVKEIDAGIQCECASNGEEALEVLGKPDTNLPDLIFLDLNMPRLNGKQCLERLKSNKDLRHIPVIIYSTSSQENDVHDTMALGAVHFLTKPSSFHELCEMLGSLIQKSRFRLQPAR